MLSPDCNIEILSPEQSSNRVIANILYCFEYGYQLGWLIDPTDRSILVFRPSQQPELLQGSDRYLNAPQNEGRSPLGVKFSVKRALVDLVRGLSLVSCKKVERFKHDWY